MSRPHHASLRRASRTALALTFCICMTAAISACHAADAPAAPQIPPLWQHPNLFSNPQAAADALDSPDILMRRSGVEWLGQWTGTYTTYGVAPDKNNCDQLQGLPLLIPRLTRAVREMPDEDSQQAARLLVQIGTPARSAIPAVCEALVKQGRSDVFKRYNVLDSLIHLCGGPSAVAPKLVALMQSSEPATRRAAAGAAGLCDDIGFNHISPAPSGAYVLPPSQSPAANIRFRAGVLPALTSRVDDSVTSVRLAALESLESLTYGSADVCLISWQKAFDATWQDTFKVYWQNTLPPLGRAVASPDPAVRLAALRVLAYMPGDVSPLSSALRGRLNSGKEEQIYALAVLCHAAGTKRTLVADVFLKDMPSPDLTQRRQAAADVRLMVMPLWNGGFFPDHEPLRWFNDDRLFARYGDSSLTPKQKEEEAKQQQAAQEQTQQRLLAALLQACSDPDASVRSDAASSLDLIGQWAAAASAHGFLFAPANKSNLTVKQALTQAATALQPTDPVRATHFREMSAYLWERQPGEFRKQKAENT